MTSQSPGVAHMDLYYRTELIETIKRQRSWARTLPLMADVILQALLPGPADRDELDSRLRADLLVEQGLDEPTWHDLESFTEEQLSELRALMPMSDDLKENGDLKSAEEVNSEEIEFRALQVAQLDAYASALEVRNVTTLGGLLDLMTKCMVLTRCVDGTYDLNPDAPLPCDVLPLKPEEATLQQQLRWRYPYEGAAQRLLSIVDAPGYGSSTITTSLQRLTRVIDMDVDQIRGGLGVLLLDGDVEISVDISVAPSHKFFELEVDRQASSRVRMTVELPNDSRK